MDRETITSYINLHSILPLLEEIVAKDVEAKEICKAWNESLLFYVLRGPTLYMRFQNGKLQIERDGRKPSSINMIFSSPSLLNRMMRGEKWAIPLLLMKPWKLGFLMGFMRLTKILERYMKMTEGEPNQESIGFLVSLLLNATLWAVKVVGEHDPHLRGVLEAMPEGVVEIRVDKEGPAGHIVVEKGRLTPLKGRAVKPDVVMELKDERVAFELFTGRLDAMASIGLGKIKIKGFIPLVDSLNAILDRIPIYLPQGGKR